MIYDAVVEGHDELLTPQEVANLTKRNKRWVYDAASNGTLPTPVRVGRHLRFRKSDISNWLKESSE